MKRILVNFLFLTFLWSASAQTTLPDVPWVPRESEDVMLQAFSWGSMASGFSFGCTKWIELSKDTVALRDNFDLIWFPPSGFGGGGGSNAGYYPQKWYSQDSDWGTTQKLKALIKSLQRGGTKVLADIVVNHHATSGGWGVFYKENFGSTYGSYQLTKADICSGDEAFTDSKSDCYNSSTHGAADTGDNDGGCRDLDHTSENVQNAVKAYVRWMRDVMGYDGFRYDMVKGYHGRYVEMYNQAAQPLFSVGENYDGNLDYIKSYLASTNYSTLVFDFPAKFAVFNSGIASPNYGSLKQEKLNKLHRDTVLCRYAVTFVDNHDTFNRKEGNEFNNATSDGASVTNAAKRKKVLEANAYMLSMPGIPCVFYPHWNAFRSQIMDMIAARKAAGVHSESRVIAEQTGANRYEALVQGHRGKLLLRIGTSRDKECPEGYVVMAQGDNYDIYVESTVSSAEQIEGQAPDATKVLENGQLYIYKNNQKYSLSGVRVD